MGGIRVELLGFIGWTKLMRLRQEKLGQ